MRRIVVTVGLLAAALGGMPAASHGAVTIGSNLQNAPNDTFNCNTTQQCTISLATLGAGLQAPGGISAPMDGVIVRWRIRTGVGGALPLALRVIRPAGAPGEFTGAGTGPQVDPPDEATTPFEVRLPVKQGDRIGLECCQGGADQIFRTLAGVTSSSFDFWGTLVTNMPLADGGAPRAPEGNNGAPPDPDGFELTINADIEADADADGFGDETQDQCPTNAATQGTCPPPPSLAAPPAPPASTAAKKCKRKKKKGAGAAKKCKRRKKR